MTAHSDYQLIATRNPDPAVRRACYLRIAAAALERAAEARRWLGCSLWARELIEVVDAGMDQRSVLAWLGELEPLAQRGLGL